LREGQNWEISQSGRNAFIDNFDIELVAAHGGMGGLQIVSTVDFHERLFLMFSEVVYLELILHRT
jgi:hypothetical protein